MKGTNRCKFMNASDDINLTAGTLQLTKQIIIYAFADKCDSDI